jgi:PhnB protein
MARRGSVGGRRRLLNQTKHVRHGLGAARPYLYGNLDLPEFVRRVFGGEEIERTDDEKGAHVEVRIGDSVVVLEIGEFPAGVEVTKASVYVYVEDVEGAYRRALEAGATSVAAPEDKPYQERGCGVKDSFGNTWWIATYRG